MELFEIIKTLQETKGTNAKIDVFKTHEKNLLLVEFLKATYEPRINYFLRPDFLAKMDADWYAQATAPAAQKFDMFLIDTIQDLLCNRRLTGNAAREYIMNIYLGLSPEERPLLIIMLAGDLRAGVSTTAINKVWPNLISTTPYMRCGLPKHTDLEEWFKSGEVIYAQTKADGTFTNFEVSLGAYSVYSRQGKVYPNVFDDIFNQLKQHINGPTVFLGEFLVNKDGVILPRQEGNGLLNSLAQGEDLPKGHTVEYHVWDAVPKIYFKKKGEYDCPYKDRLEYVRQCVGPAGTGPVFVSDTEIIKSWAEAKAHFKKMLKAGQEGSIIKLGSMKWEDGDSVGQIKLKQETVVELKVVGFREGRGKNASLFGSIIGQTEDGLLEVGVSGIKDALRKHISENRELYLGKIMAVKGNGVMSPQPDTDGKYSMYLPRLVEFRDDKMVADTLQQVIDQFEAAMED